MFDDVAGYNMLKRVFMSALKRRIVARTHADDEADGVIVAADDEEDPHIEVPI